MISRIRIRQHQFNILRVIAAVPVLNINFQHWLIEHWLIGQAHVSPTQTLQSRTEQYMGGTTYVVV